MKVAQNKKKLAFIEQPESEQALRVIEPLRTSNRSSSKIFIGYSRCRVMLLCCRVAMCVAAN